MSERINVLKKAAPYLHLYKGKIFVVKIGGEVFAKESTLENFAEQVALLHQLGINVVIVHGGGSVATELSERLGIPVKTINGRRVTSAETLEVAKFVFAGKLNTDLLASLHKFMVFGVGLSGVDGGLIQAHKRPSADVTDAESGETEKVDFGFVGDVDSVNPQVVKHLLAGNFVPVISSLAGNEQGDVYNVNADTIATQLAIALQAEKLILLTGTPGVLEDEHNPESLISHMDQDRLDTVLQKSAKGGMKAKLEACRDALQGGVPRTHIISGVKLDTLLIEVFTNEGSGTLIENAQDPDAKAPRARY
jgi:acetylglutamate kinase